jgi:site-specific DNA-methyltransferase (adenine-specific)
MPEQLLGRIIRACSNPGEIVLDPFSGSATTLAVAKKLARNFFGFELSAEYARKGTKRIEGARILERLEGADEPKVSAPATSSRQTVAGDSRQRASNQQRRKTGKSRSSKSAASKSQSKTQLEIRFE